MQKQNVYYQGIWFPYFQIQNILAEAGYPEQIIKEVKLEAHMTMNYKPSPEKLFPENLLGKKICLPFIAIGELIKQDQLYNIGLLPDPEEMKKFKLLNSNLKDLTENNIPHVTAWINEELGAEAVETSQCDFNKKLNFKLIGQFAVFNDNHEWDFSYNDNDHQTRFQTRLQNLLMSI